MFTIPFPGMGKSWSKKPTVAPDARWASGPSIDGKGQFRYVPAEPFGGDPQLGPPDVKGFAQTQQMTGGMDKGIIENIKDTLLP